MFHLKTVFRSLLCVVVLIPLLLSARPAQALDIYYRWASAPAVTCSSHIGGGINNPVAYKEALLASRPVEWLNVPAGAQLNVILLYDGVQMAEATVPLAPGTGSSDSGPYVMKGSVYPFSPSLRLETVVDGKIVYTSTLSTTCTANGTTTSSVVSGVSGASDFAGPALPANHNLVGFVRDTPVYDLPDGLATGDSMKTCQTAFVLETSTNGKWGRIFVMGGWIPLSATVDVPEDYGQASDPARLSGC